MVQIDRIEHVVDLPEGLTQAWMKRVISLR